MELAAADCSRRRGDDRAREVEAEPQRVGAGGGPPLSIVPRPEMCLPHVGGSVTAEGATEATNGPGERASWPVAMAFYRLDDVQGLPLYEITIHLQGNGVARRLDLDYGDFAVRARLVGFERLPAPKC